MRRLRRRRSSRSQAASAAARTLQSAAQAVRPRRRLAPGAAAARDFRRPVLPALCRRATAAPARPQSRRRAGGRCRSLQPCRSAGRAACRGEVSLDNVPELEPDDEVPGEVLEFFVPEVEEHLQTITDCLLALEANPNEEDIHRLFRSMHTIKGSAAQVGWQRIATIAHRAEDLVGRLRDGELKPSATIIDLCLETVDVLKKLIYRQWEDEASFQLAARTLIARLDRIAPAAESRRSPPQPHG